MKNRNFCYKWVVFGEKVFFGVLESLGEIFLGCGCLMRNLMGIFLVWGNLGDFVILSVAKNPKNLKHTLNLWILRYRSV